MAPARNTARIVNRPVTAGRARAPALPRRLTLAATLAGIAGWIGAARAQAVAPDVPVAASAPAADAITTGTAQGGHLLNALLPQDLSPWGMFLSADIVVKSVMVGLLLASVVTWTIWLAKTIEIASARRQLGRALARLADSRSLTESVRKSDTVHGPVGRMIDAAERELRLSSDAAEHEGLKERIALRLGRIEAAAGRGMTRGTGALATIGSTAPFVGLFGTVWGIMNSFIGISQAQTTNLAVVAPGIAEALLATAMGLVAAIPAVVIYNAFARAITGYRAQVGDASAEIMRLVSRDLDRGTTAWSAPRRLQAAE